MNESMVTLFVKKEKINSLLIKIPCWYNSGKLQQNLTVARRAPWIESEIINFTY